MLFNSYEFLFVFLPICFVVYYLISSLNKHFGSAWLAAASIFFYGYWSIYSLPILLTSIVVNYLFSLIISLPSSKNRKVCTILGVILNLGILSYFKYANFFVENMNDLFSPVAQSQFSLLNIVLPIGISFFTFTQIAFLIDCYNGKVREKNIIHYILFVTFFPHLIAGPLIHHKDMMSQFADEKIYKPDWKRFEIGIAVFTLGLAKKLLLADQFAPYADMLFDLAKSDQSPQVFLSWFGSLSYSFQLYFDFSGYSDMAIGLSLFFGILLPVNFNSPFKARNIIDFWQRWHMSLTSYIGQYLYTPLTLKFMRMSYGKNAYIANFLSIVFPTLFIFTLIGLWHGPSWHYVLFGFIHGLMISINHLWRKRNFLRLEAKSKLETVSNWCSWLITFLSVNASFVMFRSDSIASATKIYRGMSGLNGLSLPGFLVKYLNLQESNGVWQTLPPQHPNIVFVSMLTLAFVIVLCVPNTSSLTPRRKKDTDNTQFLRSGLAAISLGFLFLLCVLQLGKTSAFLYFQF